MSRLFSGVAATAVVLFLSISCVGENPVLYPVIPPEVIQNASALPATGSDGHQLWAFNWIYIDPGDGTMEMLPSRTPMFHMNVLSYLEYGPCTYCVSVVGFTDNGDGTHDVDVRLRHPFTMKNFTGFDVRGIMMFNGSRFFPYAGESGLYISDRTLGDGQLLNADGYTTLYNPSTIDYGPYEGYLQGKLAGPDMPNAQLNAYKRFISDPSKPRAVFEAADQVTVTYTVALPPAPLVVGYAVDASWTQAINRPVEDPWTDFDLNANCPEAWKIEVAEVNDSYLTECGGSVALTIDVYDWQGPDTSHDVMLDCPQLFDAKLRARDIEVGDGYIRYEAVVDNLNNAETGSYMCLISKDEDAPPGKPWMDPTAYQIVKLDVMEAGEPTNPVEIRLIPLPESSADVAVCGGVAAVTSRDTISIIDLYPPEDAHIAKQMEIEYVNGLAMHDNYLFLATTDPGLLIIDVRVPDEATLVKTVETTGYANGLAIDGGYAYVTTTWTGIDIIDIDPIEEAHIVNTVQVMERKTSNQIFVSDGYAYVTPTSSDLVILDIDPPEDAHVVNTVDFGGGPTDICVSNGYAYVGCAAGMLTCGKFHIFDIDPPEEAYKVRTVFIQDPVQAVDVSCGYAYLANAGYPAKDGPVIVDIDPPEEAHIIAPIPEVECAWGVDVSGPFAFITDPDAGLRIFRLW